MGLFSTHYITKTRTDTRLVPYEKTVVEKRAPTDDSIRLYDEYLEKTKERVISAFKLENSFVELLGISFLDEFIEHATAEPSILYWVKFKINGVEKTHKFRLDPFEVREMKRMSQVEADKKLLRLIFEGVSRFITAELLSQVKTTKLGLSQDYKLNSD